MSLSTYPASHKNPGTFFIALAAVLLAAPLNAIAMPQGQSGPDQIATEVTTGQLNGTTLTINSRIGYYERAVPRVSGPA